MMFDRRTLLTAAGLTGLAVNSSRAQTAAPPAVSSATPSLLERLSARAAENRHRLEFRNGGFSGPGWDLLLAEGRKAGAFLLGEEHGIAENARLTAALFSALVPAGYDTMAIETSPVIAGELDRAATEGLDGIRRLYAAPGAYAAFYSMREEAEMLAAVRAEVPAARPVLWGLDYDVGADRLAIARLKSRPKPAAAQAALEILDAASKASWALYDATRGPQHIFNFSGDPAMVAAVRTAWPDADADSAWILEVLEETLQINRLFAAGRNQASNQLRADLNKRNLRRYWRAAKAEGRTPRPLFKFGASHMVRGLSTTEAFDLGAMIPEMMTLEGSSAFHLLVLPGQGSPTAVFDPAAWIYRAGPPRDNYAGGLAAVAGQAFSDAITVIDLRPLRGLLSGGGRSASVDRELVRVVHGYDAVAVMSGSTASTNL